MRFLANENIPLKSIQILQSAGYDILAVALLMPSASDQDVLATAKVEQRIILTFDRDYGELIYSQGLPVPAGVLYLRFTPLNPEEPAQYILTLLQRPGLELQGKFTVARREQIRQRQLPKI